MSLFFLQIIDATLKGNCSRFMNHSCEPNCETQKVSILDFHCGLRFLYPHTNPTPPHYHNKLHLDCCTVYLHSSSSSGMLFRKDEKQDVNRKCKCDC